MSRQLDILALEAFYGGARRLMLETVIRCSRHRWTLLKLPPRRMERRLTAAANWFSEQLTRHWSGRVDLLFTSEAMNLANLYRMMPALAQLPSVVYFHENQLPAPGVLGGALELVNLNTAMAATEIWFNSLYHLRSFLERASALVEKHPELSSRNPMPRLTAKAHLMRPPVDLGPVLERRTAPPVRRNPQTIFVETRDADVGLLNTALDRLADRGVAFRLVTIGPVEALWERWERRTVSETDEAGHIAGMYEASIFLSVKPSAHADHLATRALTAGCRALVPSSGCYPELIPEAHHASCLYEFTVDDLVFHLLALLRTDAAQVPPDEVRQMFRPYEALAACRAFDERLEELVTANRSVG